MIEYKIHKKIDTLPEFSEDYPVFCDIETDGLYINTRLIQYYQPEVSEYVHILDVNYFGEHTQGQARSAMFKALNKLEEIKVSKQQVKDLHSKLHLVWWNGSFDQGTLGFGSKDVDDLWYMAKMSFPKLGEYNLDIVTKYLFPSQNFYGDLNKKALQKAGFKPGNLTHEQLLYSATDVYVMKLIWDKIVDIGDRLAYKIDKLNLGYTVRWQQLGLKVKESIRSKMEEEFEQKLIKVTNELPEGLNVNSYKQVRKLLDSNSSDASFLLKKIADGCPYSANIIEKRGILKTLNFLKTYKRDRVYAHYNPYGTRTGRWSCKGGDKEGAANLQQLPRKLKSCFGFEDYETKVFVGADLPTAELRLAAAIYGDDAMIDAFTNNIDIHIKTAASDANVSMDEVTKDMRKKAKASNFGLLYGMGPETFQKYAFDNYGIVYTIEESNERVNKWLATYNGIALKIRQIKKKFYNDRESLVVSTPMGRWVKPEMFTDALNIPIQGAVAEISKLWIHYMYTLSGKDVPIATMVHDSVTLECEEDEADYWQDIIKQASIRAWEEYCKLPMIKFKEIPMDVEVTIGKGYQNAS